MKLINKYETIEKIILLEPLEIHSKPKEPISNLIKEDGTLTENDSEKADVLNDFFVEWQMSLCLGCWFWFDFADE